MAIDAKIRALITQHGSITIDQMMQQALSTHNESYYQNTKNLGAAGDFITAPEISQLFGEMLGLWVIEQWQKLGSPAKFSLLELGPGQGKLMADMLRTVKLVPGLLDKITVYLYEINPYFTKLQQQILQDYQVVWLDKLEPLPPEPLIIVANEFFDSLPIKQYNLLYEQWHETVILTDPVDARLKFARIETIERLDTQFKIDHPNAKEGAIIEESPQSLQLLQQLADKLVVTTGAGIIIDYGYNIVPRERQRHQYNSTLQAIIDHHYTTILDHLGEADLTAHVDFYALAQALAYHGVGNLHYSTQRQFLLKYGILARRDILKKQLNKNESKLISKQVERLINNQQMGQLFKVLEFSTVNIVD